MPYLVYRTVPGREAALRLARGLVERRLAAGVNVLPGAQSVYRWQGRVHEAEECLLLAQVSDAAFADVQAFVRSGHPYQLPCVLALPLADGLKPFLRWIERNSRPLA